MGCNCGKRKGQGVAGVPAAALRASGGPVVTRTVNQTAAAPQMPTRTSSRPFSRLRYYVIGPDGQEESYSTLAEAQTYVRRNGSGYRIESRR